MSKGDLTVVRQLAYGIEQGIAACLVKTVRDFEATWAELNHRA